MPETAEKASIKELKRLKKMPQQMPEHAMIRNYLDLMIELPWSKASKDTLDIGQARYLLKSVKITHFLTEDSILLVIIGFIKVYFYRVFFKQKRFR